MIAKKGKAKPKLICVPDDCANSDDAGGCMANAKRGNKCLLPRIRGGLTDER